MYTQCPDCGAAFRVTAEVLKQAAGKVRCGGCSNAFNALEYLSEKIPEQQTNADAPAALPELTPESANSDSDLPKTIPAEQSAALLQTLDQLAGSDIRIEDTGVEWRVLEEPQVAEPAADDDVFSAPDTLDEAANNADHNAIEELRFDDNTPLPDGFGVDDESSSQPVTLTELAEDNHEPQVQEEPQPEITLSEPDEWSDILGEFEGVVEDNAEAAENAAVDDAVEIGDDDEEGEDLLIDEHITQLDFIEEQEEPIIEQHAIEDELTTLEESAESQEDDHYVAPLSEEEQTVNMMIDEDLMSLAIEDKDGFASTIIIGEQEFAALKESDEEQQEEQVSGEEAGFETIIMEGEAILSVLDDEKLETDAAAAAESVLLANATQEEDAPLAGRMRYGIIGGIVILVLLLLVQVLHESRETLAKIPVFNDLIGPVYRTLGQPLQPDWDVSGWRFEATKGSTDTEINGNTDATNEQVTIYSRIGNKSDAPLPYPLIGISLTDRFEETIGSRVLDPAEYLPDNLDPRKLVPPGNTFDAVISIQAPSADATGFKLNVCYRLSQGKLRCALDDFR